MTAMPGPPLAVTVLTGFLGAGKTTLLLRLLRQPHDARIAVVLNEVGVAGTEELELDETSYLELTEGCVCCVRASDLREALTLLAARGDVDRVVIETTGIADPLALTFVLERPDLENLARLDAVVTVVDAANWDKTRVPEWDAQVGAADLLVLAKTDLAPETERLRAAVSQLNRAVRILDATEVSLEVVLDVERRATAAPAEHAHHSGFQATTIASSAIFDRDQVEDLLEMLPRELYRAKGIVRTDAGWIAFHVVGGRLQSGPTAAPQHGETRIVLIGQGADEASLRALFAAAELAST
jgi:G3E family GTPase